MSMAFSGRPAMTRRYSRVAITLHWLIAAAVLTNLYVGWRMSRVEGMDKFTLFQLHKSVGMTVLALSVLRLAWRVTHRPPPYPATISSWERAAARAVHAIFYLLMIGMPLSGWIIVSASPLNIPTLLYATAPLPHLAMVHDLPLDRRQTIEASVGTGHMLVAYLFAALIVLHVGAALKHRFVERDDVLGGMLPGRSPAPEQG